MGLDNPIHIAFLLILLLLVFGAKRLPEMGKSLGSGMRGFKDALSGEQAEPTAIAAPAPARSRGGAGAQRARRRARGGVARRAAGRARRARSHGGSRRQHRPRGPAERRRPSRRSCAARLIISLAALAVAFGLCMWQNHALLSFINKPLAHQTQKQVKAGNGPLGATYTRAAERARRRRAAAARSSRRSSAPAAASRRRRSAALAARRAGARQSDQRPLGATRRATSR